MDFLHWFIDPITKHYADFEGRVGRQEFWMYILFYVIAYAIIDLFSIEILSALIALALFIPNIAIGARRLHDIGKSGWWQLIGIIPIIGWIIIIVWLATPGEKVPNMYGAVPADKQPGNPGAPAATATDAPVAQVDAPAPAVAQSEDHSSTNHG